ncbi:hemolysin activation/secretion protein [Leptolyngbya sp. PCC 7375]|nr:hemolysin activation/secretion protein [Leptolyngbya sp. PCC 7375]
MNSHPSGCLQNRQSVSQNGLLLAAGLMSAISVLHFLSPHHIEHAQAQTTPVELPRPQDTLPPPLTPQPEPLPAQDLPSADELLDQPQEQPNQSPIPIDSGTFLIDRFEFVNNTAFDDETLQGVTNEFTGESQTFADVAAARAAVTQLYIDEGYATSGAIVPQQQIVDGIVLMEIIEGSLSEILVTGNRRLHPGYISSRIALGATAPLNVNTLVKRLQLLQLDPLITTISADLQASPQAGQNRLVVSVVEADSFGITYTLDNNRSPSVGTVRNQLQATEANLLGLGDRLSIGYTTTSGSNGINIDYTLPISPHGSTLRLAIDTSDNDVIEEPFDALDIDSDSNFFELALKYPLKFTPAQEFAIGLTASHQRAQTSLGIDNIGPIPLSLGADNEGRTRVSALRFFQAWTQRSKAEVLALRSQFNLGLDMLDATVNDGDIPDSRFFSWQGQAQWLRILAPDTLLLLKGSAQLTTDPLLSLEQLSLGGQSTVRGYRQNLLSTDNGLLASAEVRLPIWRDRTNDRLLQVTPFLDAGYGWNREGNNPDPLASVGIGLLFRQQDMIGRLDWGIPLISEEDDRDSLQKNGLYFTLQYSFF